MKKKKRKPNIPNIILTIISIIFLLVIVYKFDYKITDDMLPQPGQANTFNNILQENTTKTEDVKDISINIAAVGDIMCHNTQYQDAYDKNTDSYDFAPVFSNIADDLRSADLTIGNLETTFAGKEKGYSGYPTFNTPEALATNLKEIGFDVLTTANNHCMDSGYKGLEKTIDTLDSVGISHTGTFKSAEEQNTLLIKDVNGIKIAFISYTYGTNGIPIPSGREYSVNLINKDKIKQDIDKAKEAKVDLIFACMHWGNEYRLSPTTEQEDLANFLFKNGVDVILGNHPHVLEPMEERKITLDDGTVKDGFLIYSFGNFVSAQNKQYTNHSIILNMKFTKHKEGNMTIDDINYIPIYVDNRGKSASPRYKILNINTSIKAYEDGTDDTISKDLYNRLVTARDATEKILKN